MCLSGAMLERQRTKKILRAGAGESESVSRLFVSIKLFREAINCSLFVLKFFHPSTQKGRDVLLPKSAMIA